MITQLSKKEITKLENSTDKHSARCVCKIGDTTKVGTFFKKTFVLVNKIIFKIDTCPYCGGHNTYHKVSQDVYKNTGINYDNVYKVYKNKTKNGILFHKIDYCFNCHREFSIEMFVWLRKRWLDKQNIKV